MPFSLGDTNWFPVPRLCSRWPALITHFHAQRLLTLSGRSLACPKDCALCIPAAAFGYFCRSVNTLAVIATECCRLRRLPQFFNSNASARGGRFAGCVRYHQYFAADRRQTLSFSGGDIIFASPHGVVTGLLIWRRDNRAITIASSTVVIDITPAGRSAVRIIGGAALWD